MSVALTEPVDVRAEAARERSANQRVSLSQLPRLVEALHEEADRDGTVHVELALRLDESRRVCIDGRLRGDLIIRCQRCLGPLDLPVDVTLALRSGALPDGDFELADEPARLLDLVEDELLLALPDVPTHTDLAACGPDATRYLVDAGEPQAQTKTPFAGLKDLLDASNKNDSH